MIVSNYNAALLLGLGSLQGALAWGAVGHEIVATIAQIHLFPSTASKLCSLLPSYAKCHLAPVATWADVVRGRDPRFRWTGSLHYVNAVNDNPPHECTFGEKGGWQGAEGVNVLTGIQNTTFWLKEERDGGEEALKFLIHFLGDVHQPLHLSGRDKGGTGAQVRFDNRQTNLHSLWDSGLIAKSLRTIPQNYTRPLHIPRVEKALRETIYDPYIRQIIWEGILDRFKEQVDTNEWLQCPNPPQQPHQFTSVSFLPEFIPDLSVPVWMQGGLVDGWIQSAVGALGLQRVNTQPPTDDEVVCPYSWSIPSHALNCEIVWPKDIDEHRSIADSDSDLDNDAVPSNVGAEDETTSDDLAGRPRKDLLELDTPQYWGKIKKQFLVERQLAMGGLRLAGVLNYLFADPEEVKRLDGVEFRDGGRKLVVWGLKA